MMNKISCSLFCLTGLVIFLGCSSTPTNSIVISETERTPSNIEYINAENCKKVENEESQLSPLTGYLVGPLARKFQSPSEKILRPFNSDGCSTAPDGVPLTKNKNIWTECCIQHDLKYWVGGTAEDARLADSNLRQCIKDKNYPITAAVFETFVKLLGGPNSDRSYRWGYGWNYRRSYGALGEEEISQVDGLIKNEFDENMIRSSRQGYRLTRMCNTYDPIFNHNKFLSHEKNIYNFLNNELHKNDIIEWARWGYFNMEESHFDFKLKNCTEPLKIILKKDSSISFSKNKSCDL